jgi:hypothetical protein
MSKQAQRLGAPSDHDPNVMPLGPSHKGFLCNDFSAKFSGSVGNVCRGAHRRRTRMRQFPCLVTQCNQSKLSSLSIGKRKFPNFCLKPYTLDSFENRAGRARRHTEGCGGSNRSRSRRGDPRRKHMSSSSPTTARSGHPQLDELDNPAAGHSGHPGPALPGGRPKIRLRAREQIALFSDSAIARISNPPKKACANGCICTSIHLRKDGEMVKFRYSEVRFAQSGAAYTV